MLLEELEQGLAETDSSALEKLEQALENARRCAPEAAAIDKAISEGSSVYVTTCWGDASTGQLIRSADDLPDATRFGLRLVEIPA